MPTLYLSDGTANNKIKKLYYSDGTANSKLKSLYESDGTAWYKVFSGYDCQASLTYTVSSSEHLNDDYNICTLNNDGSGEIHFRAKGESVSSASYVTLTFIFTFEKDMPYDSSTPICSFIDGEYYSSGIADREITVYDADDEQLAHYTGRGLKDIYTSYTGSTNSLKITYDFYVSGTGDKEGYYHFIWNSLQVFGQDLENIKII